MINENIYRLSVSCSASSLVWNHMCHMNVFRLQIWVMGVSTEQDCWRKCRIHEIFLLFLLCGWSSFNFLLPPFNKTFHSTSKTFKTRNVTQLSDGLNVENVAKPNSHNCFFMHNCEKIKIPETDEKSRVHYNWPVETLTSQWFRCIELKTPLICIFSPKDNIGIM